MGEGVVEEGEGVVEEGVGRDGRVEEIIILGLIRDLIKGQQTINAKLDNIQRQLNDYVIPINNDIHAAEPVNHLNNDLELQELITIHQSSSSNINFAVNLARRSFTSNELKDNRTWFVGHRRRGGGQKMFTASWTSSGLNKSG